MSERNLIKQRVYCARYRRKYPEKTKVRHAKWRAENAEKWRQYCAAYHIANREKHRQYYIKWQAANPEKRRQSVLKRRAIKAGATIGDLKAIAAWEKTWRTAKAVTCYWCGKKFPGRTCHADHVIPLGKHGPHDLNNLVVACKKCNLKKKDKRPEKWNRELNQPRLFV
jgi:5-methylcytosine-specific restriction endonuclease McrA